MSSDEDKIEASINKTNNDKEIDNSQNERVSLTFVDSIFSNIQNKSKEVKDPLNTKNNGTANWPIPFSIEKNFSNFVSLLIECISITNTLNIK